MIWYYKDIEKVAGTQPVFQPQDIPEYQPQAPRPVGEPVEQWINSDAYAVELPIRNYSMIIHPQWQPPIEKLDEEKNEKLSILHKIGKAIWRPAVLDGIFVTICAIGIIYIIFMLFKYDI